MKSTFSPQPPTQYMFDPPGRAHAYIAPTQYMFDPPGRAHAYIAPPHSTCLTPQGEHMHIAPSIQYMFDPPGRASGGETELDRPVGQVLGPGQTCVSPHLCTVHVSAVHRTAGDSEVHTI